MSRRRSKRTRGNKAPDNEPASKKANTMPSPQFYPESPVAAPDPHNHDGIPSRQELEAYYGNMNYKELQAECGRKGLSKGGGSDNFNR